MIQCHLSSKGSKIRETFLLHKPSDGRIMAHSPITCLKKGSNWAKTMAQLTFIAFETNNHHNKPNYNLREWFWRKCLLEVSKVQSLDGNIVFLGKRFRAGFATTNIHTRKGAIQTCLRTIQCYDTIPYRVHWLGQYRRDSNAFQIPRESGFSKEDLEYGIHIVKKPSIVHSIFKHRMQ